MSNGWSVNSLRKPLIAAALVLLAAAPVRAQHDSAPFRRVYFGATSGTSVAGPVITAASDCTIISAPKGSICTDTDDGTIYQKTSTGTSGWSSISSATPTLTSVSLADGSLGGPSLKFTNLSSAGLYLNTTGSSGVGVSGLLFVGNGTAAFTSPTRRMHLAESRATPGATDVSALVVSQTNTPVSSAHTGTERAFIVSNTSAGTQNATESSALVATSGDTTSGVVTTQNGVLGATTRTGGNTTTASSFRADKAVTGGTTTTGISFLASSPVVSGGGAMTSSFGLYLQNQFASGVTNGYQLRSDHDSSGGWSLFHDGSFLSQVNKTSAGTFVQGGAAEHWLVTYTGGAGSGYHYQHQFTTDVQASGDTSSEAWVNQFSYIKGNAAHNLGTLIATYAGTDLSGGPTVDAWDPVNGGGVHGYVADANHYGTTTIGLLSDFTAWGGTGTGATVTNWYGFYVPQFYEYAGSVTTHVGLQIDDQASSPVAGITNNYAIRVGTPSGNTILTATGAWSDAPGTQTIADSGNGSAATATLTPTTTLVKVTCSDADGCTETMGESGVLDGQIARIVNVSANTVTFADTSGVSELAGSAALGQWDSITLQYITDRWVELSRSNN